MSSRILSNIGKKAKTFSVVVIPMLADNYSYYIHPTEDIQQGYFVDVADKTAVLKFRKAFGITAPISHILSTHKHFDHTGANHGLKRQFPDV